MSRNRIISKQVKDRKRWSDYQNNTNVSLVNKYIYFAVDKVANSTIKRHFFEMEYRPVRKEVLSLYDPRCSPLLSPYQLPYSVNELLSHDDFFKFAFVRNPYSRLLSCYLDRISTLTSIPSREFRQKFGKENFVFEDFVRFVCNQRASHQNSHWRIQSADILYDLVEFDHIGKFENLNNDLKVIHENIFTDPFNKEVLKKNYSPNKTSASNKIEKYYNQELLDMVFESFKEDFENFGYDRHII